MAFDSLEALFEYAKRPRYAYEDGYIVDADNLPPRKCADGKMHEKVAGKWREVPLVENAETEMLFMSTTSEESLIFSEYIKSLGYKNNIIPSVADFIKDTKSRKYDGSAKTPLEKQVKHGLSMLKNYTGGSFKAVIFMKNKAILNDNSIAFIMNNQQNMKGVLFINENAPFWKYEKLQKEVLKNTSTRIPSHVFLHEYGHCLHPALIKEWQNDEDIETAETLSISQINEPAEFIAELYAAKYAGLEIKPEWIHLYNRYGGNYEDL